MRVGCPREIKNHEYRVGLTPESARELTARGHEVWIESGAGLGIGASDRAKDQMLATREVAALAHHTAIERIYDQLRDGRLATLREFVKVGGGHSMGGFMTITLIRACF